MLSPDNKESKKSVDIWDEDSQFHGLKLIRYTLFFNTCSVVFKNVVFPLPQTPDTPTAKLSSERLVTNSFETKFST